uniref:Uncharacterized protein n=1 Tax=Hyaloperonospora arabidopsidis (strain Emoy2) TaxID=559515 RepID=M4B9N1_HYAAE
MGAATLGGCTDGGVSRTTLDASEDALYLTGRTATTRCFDLLFVVVNFLTSFMLFFILISCSSSRSSSDSTLIATVVAGTSLAGAGVDDATAG